MIRTSKIMIHYKILVSYDVVKSEEIPEALLPPHTILYVIYTASEKIAKKESKTE